MKELALPSKLNESAMAAVTAFTREKMRQGDWFEAKCRPWMYKFFEFCQGKGPHPGPSPSEFPPDDWEPVDVQTKPAVE
jgi:hypothetical protein